LVRHGGSIRSNRQAAGQASGSYVIGELRGFSG